MKRTEIKKKIDKLFKEYLVRAIPEWDKWVCYELYQRIVDKEPLPKELVSAFEEMCLDYKL